jgi:hypothetical protein
MTPASLPTTADLREQYARTGLEAVGIGFDRAIQSPVILISLIAAIKGRRRIAARQARNAAINYQLNQEITPC